MNGWAPMCILIAGVPTYGCASTTIDVPGWGRYHSTRDSTIEQLSISVSISPDGTRTVVGELRGAGMASPVNASYADLVRAWTDLGAIIAGAAAARAVGP